MTGATSTTARPIDGNQDTALADISFTDGKATPEIAANSGDIVYIENRRQITRAADQIEDIKLVIEFWSYPKLEIMWDASEDEP